MKYLSMKQISGFTLIELIFVTVVGAILASWAVPSFQSATQNARQQSAIRDLLTEFEYARSEAIKRNTSVTICGSTDGLICDTANWDDGRLVFVDDGAGTPANTANGAVNGEDILKVFGGFPGNISARSTVFSNAGYIVFFGDGAVIDVGTMVVCDDRGVADSSLIKAVNVSIVGQSRNAYDSDETEDGVVNNISGANVACL
jgi:type IV fimbrial biogenesis protein FimT